MFYSKLFFLAVLTAVLFAQCKPSGKINQKKPEEVAIAFIRHFSKLEFDKLKPLCTEETNQIMTFMENAVASISEEERKKTIEETEANMKSIKKATCKITGDEAKCTFCCEPNGKETQDPITLKKKDKKWFVHFSKEDMPVDGGGE